MSHVLVVDDEPSICWGFRELLTGEGHDVSIAPSAEEAFKLAERRRPDAVVLDIRLPGMDGLTAMAELRKRIGPDVPIVVVTAFGNLDTAVRAVHSGAFDYLAKPFDLEHAAQVLQRALAKSIQPPVAEPTDLLAEADELVGSSPAMQVVFKQIALVAGTDLPVLLTGESGTGKEQVAQAIHRHSPRRTSPFVPICLGALSEHVIESELFGHVKGAFTGAEANRAGLLELAHGGTVLLDEIGDVPLAVQVKLLRAIERHEVTPVGDPRPRGSDFRVIAATNRPLAELVAAGRFREDLLYRLSVFHIELPPLRERRDDIPLLANFFLRRVSRAGQPASFSADTLRELCSRAWHGNVRELRNAVERAAIVARSGEIQPQHLASPLTFHGSEPASSETRLRDEIAAWTRRQLESDRADAGVTDLYERFLHEVEPALFRTLLEHCQNNRALAARLLGIHRSTLRQKLNAYDIEGS